MKQENQRALNAFAALNALPDDLILNAERALTEAETGIAIAPKPQGRFARFLNSGWGVAAIAGIVSIIVLVIMIRAGKEPAPYEPPVKPAGSTIEMSSEGASFTISTETANYPEGTNRFTVVLTGKVKGEAISVCGGWHLERLTDNGAEAVEFFYTDDALVSAQPDKDAYATVKKTIYGTNTGGGFPAGTYRLHATKHDGEKYVSVAWCEFTVGIPAEETETPPIMEFPPAHDRPYTVTTPNSIEYGATGLPITVTATEQGVDLMPHRKYSIVKLAGVANGAGADQLQSLEAVVVRPDEQTGGYAVYHDSLTLLNPNEWYPGLYRLYALNYDGAYIDYCDFVICEEDYEHLTTNDPDKTVERGVFFWANGSPFINLSWGGEVYPVSFSVETDTVDFSGLTTGDVVEMVMGEFVEETFPAHGYLYDIRKLSDGSPSDLPAAMVGAMEDMGYKITEAKESE